MPTIKAVFTQPGVMDVFWDAPPKDSRHLIKAYQVCAAPVKWWGQVRPR